MFVKFLIGAILMGDGLGGDDGWFPVEKVPKASEVMSDIDSSIWVLFSKDLGDEQFSIRFPEEPFYRSSEGGHFLVRALKGGDIYELSAEPRDLLLEGSAGDRSFEWEGKWVHEHTVQTSSHTYHLRLYTSNPMAQSAKEFISSFSSLVQ